MQNKTIIQGGIGLSLGPILFIVFLVLKLTYVIDWSWWWVTAPLWISIVLSIILNLVIMFFCLFPKSLNKTK